MWPREDLGKICPAWPSNVIPEQARNRVNCQGRAIMAANEFSPFKFALQFSFGYNVNDSLNTQNSFLYIIWTPIDFLAHL